MAEQRTDPVTQIDEIKHSILTDDEAAKHRLIDDGAPSSTKLWSSEKIDAEISVSGDDGLTLVTKKTANYTAGTNEEVPYDPAAGQTLKPPASPNLGDQWAIKNVTTDTTPVTIDGNGQNIEDPVNGGVPSSSFSLGVANIGAHWRFMNSDTGNAWHSRP